MYNPRHDNTVGGLVVLAVTQIASALDGLRDGDGPAVLAAGQEELARVINEYIVSRLEK